MNKLRGKKRRVLTVLLSILVIPLMLFSNVPYHAYSPVVKNVEYGVSVHNLTSKDVQLVSDAKFGWIRVDDYQLGNVISLTQGKHINILGIIHDFNDFTNGKINFNLWNYTVLNLVSKYGESVQAWEILNEPLVSLPDGHDVNFPATEYFTMLRDAYTIIKSIDPNSIVLGFGGVRVLDGNIQNISWVADLISMGALNYCDAISLHFYSGSSIASVIGVEYGSALLQLGLLFANKSLWVTETGQPADMKQSNYINVVYPLFNSFGIDHVFWYELRDSASDQGKQFGLLESNYTQRDSYLLLKQMDSEN